MESSASRRRVCQSSLINFNAVLAWRRGPPGCFVSSSAREGGMNGESLGKERRKGDARVQFSLRLLESSYVRLVRSPVGPRDREPCGWPATQTWSLSSTGPLCPLRLFIPLSVLSPSPLPPINLPALYRVSFLRTGSLGSLSCFALCSLRDLRVINTTVATLSSPALSLSFKFHFSLSLSLVQRETGGVNRIPLLSALFSWRSTTVLLYSPRLYIDT